jgi:low affinity Fe/Cu permease
MNKRSRKTFFESIAKAITQVAGTSVAFIIALTVILVWAITGPLFKFSDTWQLVINTGTTVITFLMVFLIQRSQNKDSKAIHLKLNELIASLKGPSNRLIDVEDMNEEELETLHKYYCSLSELAKKENDLSQSHSVEEAISNHKDKYKRKTPLEN